jgi:hypothetical protein
MDDGRRILAVVFPEMPELCPFSATSARQTGPEKIDYLAGIRLFSAFSLEAE